MTPPGKQAPKKKKPPARKSSPKGSKTKDPAEALLTRLEDAFSEAELRQILAGALLGMDRAAQERLCARLGATGATLAPLLGLASSAQRQVLSNASPQRLAQDWQALWKEWDRIIKATDDEDGPYLQNEISYNNLDLADAALVADLDKIASKLLPLLPHHFTHPGPKPFDLVRKVSSSLGKIAPSHVDYIILPEDEVSLGAATTRLVLTWLWGHDPEQTPTAKLVRLGKLAEELFEGELCFVLDGATLSSFFGRLGVNERKELSQWLEKNRKKEPWQQAFDEESGPCAPIVALLGET